MAFSDEQIRTWAQRPMSILPRFTIDIVKDALAGAPRLRWQRPEIYVQGSYANETNIDELCDVDLVVQLPMPFEADTGALSASELEKFFEHYGWTDYGWEEFREDVTASFRRSFFVDEGKRCLTLSDWDALWRVPADILPALEFRRYQAFPHLLGEVYDEGVYFRASKRYPIVNYPKIHLRRGNTKNRDTHGRFKQIVRVAKNARAKLQIEDAPSYFIECLLFNVPARQYRADLGDAYRRVVEWLGRHRDDLPAMRCQNGIVPMFGDHFEAWKVDAAVRFISALTEEENSKDR
jgi:hypothetical protein